MATKSFDKAKKNKADEFYTQMSDIELEMRHYKEQFRDKIVLCNCDDPYESNFFKYFAMNFNFLGLKKLITISYSDSPVAGQQLPLFNVKSLGIKNINSRPSHKIEISEVNDENADGAIDLADVEYLLNNKKNTITLLEGNGDFRSEECIDFLKEADIIVTNPPFSLFREYVAQLIEFRKKFIIIGNVNAITYKEIFKLISDNKIWLGQSIHSGDREFRVPDYYPLHAAGFRVDKNGVKYIRVKGVRWFTNLDFEERYENITLYKNYTPEHYPSFDNYDAIEVSKTVEIPIDYDGNMCVPITFMDKYNPEQFEIVDALNRYSLLDAQGTNKSVRQNKSHTCNINGKTTYFRIVIRKKGGTKNES